MPGEALHVTSKAQLIAVSTGKVTTLYESSTDAAWQARFAGDIVEVDITGGTRRFNLDGTPAPPPANPPSCVASAGNVTIGGKSFPGVPNCGAFSPDGRWMTFERPAGDVTPQGGPSVPSWDQWVLDTQTNATRELYKGLLHCGGCDGRYGPRWAPTSRYVAYAEYGGKARRFLSDMTAGQTRIIGEGNQVNFAPEWASNGNRLVYSITQTIPAAARFEDLDRGVAAELPIPWPAGFDWSGLYLYSPAWGEGPKETGKSTTVITASTLSTTATLSGTPPAWLPWRPDDSPVAVGGRGVVAALQRASGCEGTSITVGSSQPTCIAGGASGNVNGQTTLVAVAKAVGVTGPAKGPGFETASLTRYDIELFDVATGKSHTALLDVLSWDYQSPVVIWNESGTHILVLAPSATGL